MLYAYRRRLLLTALLAGLLGAIPLTTAAEAGGGFQGSGGKRSITLRDEDRGGIGYGSGNKSITGSPDVLLDEDRGGWYGSGS